MTDPVLANIRARIEYLESQGRLHRDAAAQAEKALSFHREQALGCEGAVAALKDLEQWAALGGPGQVLGGQPPAPMQETQGNA